MNPQETKLLVPGWYNFGFAILGNLAVIIITLIVHVFIYPVGDGGGAAIWLPIISIYYLVINVAVLALIFLITLIISKAKRIYAIPVLATVAAIIVFILKVENWDLISFPIFVSGLIPMIADSSFIKTKLNLMPTNKINEDRPL